MSSLHRRSASCSPTLSGLRRAAPTSSLSLVESTTVAATVAKPNTKAGISDMTHLAEEGHKKVNTISDRNTHSPHKRFPQLQLNTLHHSLYGYSTNTSKFTSPHSTMSASAESPKPNQDTASQETNMHICSNCHENYQFYSKPSASIAPTLSGLRFLISLDQHHRENNARDAARLQHRLIRLKLASRLLAQSDDDYCQLRELLLSDQAREFAQHYERRCQDLEQVVNDQIQASLDGSVSTNILSLYTPTISFLDKLAPVHRRVCIRFIAYLRVNPGMITTVFQRLSDEELQALLPDDDGSSHGTVPASPLVSPDMSLGIGASGSSSHGTAGNGTANSPVSGHQSNNVVDLLLWGIFGTPDFLSEQRLRLQLWTTVFVRLINERRGERFLLKVMNRFVRLSGWCPPYALETPLLKILRRGEEIVLEHPSTLTTTSLTSRSSLSYLDIPGTSDAFEHTAGDASHAAAVDAFFEHACEEILGVVEQCIPPMLTTLTQSVLAELHLDQRSYGTILMVVQFFFYRFLGRAITYPEYYGMCDDYYISEEQRKEILFKTNQRLYRYATAVCSATPGWENVTMSPRVRNLLERIVSRFSPSSPDTNASSLHHESSSDTSLLNGLLTPASSTPYPPAGLFPYVTPTLLIRASDVVTLYDFMSTGRLARSNSRSPPNSSKNSSYASTVRRHYSFSYSSTSSAAAAISAIDSREEFFILLTQMEAVMRELRECVYEPPVLLYTADDGHTLLLKDPQTALNGNQSASQRTSWASRHRHERSDVSTISSGSSVITLDDDADEEMMPELDDNDAVQSEVQSIGSAIFRALGAFDVHYTQQGMSIESFLELAARMARERLEFADSVIYRNALERLRRLPDEYREQNGAKIIRLMAQTFDRAAERRALQQQYRNVWWAYAQDTQRRIQEALAHRVYQFGSLRLRMFYNGFRQQRVYERARREIIDLARRTQITEAEEDEIDRYIEMREINSNLVPGDYRFHLFCRDVERLKEQAMQALWHNEMYAREAKKYGPSSVRVQDRRQRGASGVSIMSRFSFGRSTQSSASADRESRALMPLGNQSFSSLTPVLSETNRRHSMAPDTVYASLLGYDFVTTTQLKLIGLIMSEFHLLFRYSETDAWFNQFIAEDVSESPVLRPAAEPVQRDTNIGQPIPSLQIQNIPIAIPSERKHSLSLSRRSSTASGIGLASAPIVTTVTAVATTSGTLTSAPMVRSESMDASTSSSTCGSPPLFNTGLRRIDSVATLVPVAMTPRSPAGSVRSDISARSECDHAPSLDTTSSPGLVPAGSSRGSDSASEFERPLDTPLDNPTEETAKASLKTHPSQSGVSLNDPTYALAQAYHTLCTQLTLHPSPFRKLHTILSLNLLVSASLSLVEAPGTDAIVNELTRVLRQVRPRYLCRDLQVIATFSPDSIISTTGAGKAYTDMCVVVSTLKREIVARIMKRARDLLEGGGTVMRRSSADDRELQLRQYEAFRLYRIAAHEGVPEGQRELAILYLTLPITPDDYMGFEADATPSFNDIGNAFVSSSYSNLAMNYGASLLGRSAPVSNMMSYAAMGNRGPYGNIGAAASSASLRLNAHIAETRSEKYNPANVAAAMKWFRRAAKQGDEEAIRALRYHQSGGSGLLV